MAPDDSEAYEQDWYRTMKALADRREPPAGDAPAPPRGSDETLGMAQIAAIEAVEALGDIGGTSAVSALIECLHDPDAPVRIRVIEMLDDLGDRRAVPALRAVAGDDSDPAVVNVAKETLAHLDVP